MDIKSSTTLYIVRKIARASILPQLISLLETKVYHMIQEPIQGQKLTSNMSYENVITSNINAININIIILNRGGACKTNMASCFLFISIKLSYIVLLTYRLECQIMINIDF